MSSDSSSSSFSLSGGDNQADDASTLSEDQASYPLSFLMPDCSALQGLDAQVSMSSQLVSSSCPDSAIPCRVEAEQSHVCVSMVLLPRDDGHCNASFLSTNHVVKWACYRQHRDQLESCTPC